jgi:acyl dehydratase
MTADLILPDRVQTLSGACLTAYAGATWDWFQVHVDSDAAVAAGFAAPVVDGQMLGALLAAHAQDGLPAGARVVAMSFRNSAPVHRGETVRVAGEVVDRMVSGDAVRITVRQQVYAGDEPSRTVVTNASTVLLVPLRASPGA